MPLIRNEIKVVFGHYNTGSLLGLANGSQRSSSGILEMHKRDIVSYLRSFRERRGLWKCEFQSGLWPWVLL